MDYCSTKEMSQQWGISQNRITILAKSGRIPDAVMVGKSWMIPKDTPKPPDRRRKTVKDSARDSEDYRFPLTALNGGPGSRFYPNYTQEDILLRNAFLLMEKGEFEQATRDLQNLLISTKNKWTQLGALYISCFTYLFLKEFHAASSAYLQFRILATEEISLHPELSIILTELSLCLEEKPLIIPQKTLNPLWQYCPESHPYTLQMAIYEDLLQHLYSDNSFSYPVYELCIRNLEQLGCESFAMYMHYYIASAYYKDNNEEYAHYHMKQAVILAEKNQTFTLLCANAYYLLDYFEKALNEVIPEKTDQIIAFTEKLFEAVQLFLKHNHSFGIRTKLDNWDYRLIGYVLRKTTIKEIARENHLSEKTINQYYSRLYKKLGVSKRSELRQYITEATLLKQ